MRHAHTCDRLSAIALLIPLLAGACVAPRAASRTVGAGEASRAVHHAARAAADFDGCTTSGCALNFDPSLPPLPADYSAPGSAQAIVACFSRENPPAPEVIAEFQERLFGLSLQYQLAARWTTTASGPTGGQGNPITITWSLVPDGLSIPGSQSGQEEPSVLFARMDQLFGGNRALWIQRITDAFARWEQVTGNQYVRIRDRFGNDWDDGAAWGTAGFLERRGDIRICMRTVDGASGILAYNQFPNQGDMVLDAAESWADSSDNHRFLRNVITHENGHGMGLFHVCPPNSTKVMEPFLATNFDGPQQDDIRAMQRHYGDFHEGDDTPGTAAELGTFGPNANVLFGSTPTSIPSVPGAVSVPAMADASVLSIDADGEQDWSAIDLSRPLLVSVTVTPIGTTYQNQPQSGDECPEGNPVNALNRANLRLQVWEQTGVLPLILVNDMPQGQAEDLMNLLLPAGRSLIRITEANTPTEVQLYSLRVRTGAALSFTASDGTFDDRVVLSWTAIPNRTTYSIFRGTSPDRSAATLIGTTTGTSFNDFTALRGPTYTYWVQTSQTLTDNYLVDFGGPEIGFRNRPPCPPDFNADGTLDADDLGDFINCYFASPPCPQANFNGDGAVDADDLGDYINAYFAGC
ncbi:MAG: matrixin family metalloprotease [Phycisphaerales bacterium]